MEESLAPGASVVEVARRHDVHRNLVTAWRRLTKMNDACTHWL
nr:transposase [Bradyrhizobium sp. 195]